MTTRRRTRTAALVLLLAPLLAACGGEDDGAEATGGGTEAEVRMELIAFKPGDLEVATGTTVTWSNRDVGAHTVTSGTVEQGGGGVTPDPDGTFDSGQVANGDTFRHPFEEPGTYSYFCSLHPATMRGTVRVT